MQRRIQDFPNGEGGGVRHEMYHVRTCCTVANVKSKLWCLRARNLKLLQRGEKFDALWCDLRQYLTAFSKIIKIIF